MSTEPSTSPTTGSATTTATASDSTPPPVNASAVGNWKLPNGIEDHIEDGVIKMTAGILIGGTLGVLLFKSGKGWRSASIASGLGVAMGSTYVRLSSSMMNTTTSSPNTTNLHDVVVTSSSSNNTTLLPPPRTPPGTQHQQRLPPFDAKSLPIIPTTPTSSSSIEK